MLPVLFQFHLPDFLPFGLGGQEVLIYSYAFMVVFGTVIASWYTTVFYQRDTGAELSKTFFYVVFAAGFFGGKILFWLEDPQRYIAQPALLTDLTSGGFVFYGSFIGIFLFLYAYTRWRGIPLSQLIDVLGIACFIALGSGRIGCFLAGCCYGQPTDSGFGIVFPRTAPVAVFPVQLIEVLVCACIVFIVHRMRPSRQYAGQSFVYSTIIYASYRTVMEWFRGDTRGYIIDGILSHSQLISIILIICGIIFHIYKSKKIQP